MDGAAKFVRGDAIAGLIITFINIIGGIIIGVVRHGMPLRRRGRTPSRTLTVGDGLVTQIPALLVSTAAGILVTKAGVEGSTDKALFRQLGGYPQRARHGSAVLLASLALLPGMPIAAVRWRWRPSPAALAWLRLQAQARSAGRGRATPQAEPAAGRRRADRRPRCAST